MGDRDISFAFDVTSAGSAPIMPLLGTHTLRATSISDLVGDSRTSKTPISDTGRHRGEQTRRSARNHLYRSTGEQEAHKVVHRRIQSTRRHAVRGIRIFKPSSRPNPGTWFADRDGVGQVESVLGGANRLGSQRQATIGEDKSVLAVESSLKSVHDDGEKMLRLRDEIDAARIGLRASVL